jgi:hypothetical protein
MLGLHCAGLDLAKAMPGAEWSRPRFTGLWQTVRTGEPPLSPFFAVAGLQKARLAVIETD